MLSGLTGGLVYAALTARRSPAPVPALAGAAEEPANA